MALPLDALLLILLGGLCHATWNLYSKHAANNNVTPVVFMWGSNVVSLLLFTPLVLPALPSVVRTWSALPWLLVCVSASLHLYYSTLLQQGYHVSDYGVVYPLARGTGALFACVLAIVLLAEWPNPHQWVGLIFIITGVFLVSGVKSLWTRLFTSHPDDRAMNGLRYGMSIGGLIALYTVVDGYAVKRLALPALSYYWLGIVLRTLMLTPYALEHHSELSLGARIRALTWGAPYRRTIVWVGVLSPLAYWFALLAAQRAPVSFVAPLREISMLFAMLLGAYFLKEKQPVSRIIGACAMVVGILFLL